jgi:translation initiation factor 5B
MLFGSRFEWDLALLQEEEEEEEDWDAKSFEEVNLPAIKSAFAEEEADDGPVKAGQVTVPPPSAPPAATKPAPSSPKKKPAPPSKSQQKFIESEDEDEEDEDDEDEDSEEDADVKKRQQAKVKREARRAEALKKRSAEDLRSPICCILGHVDLADHYKLAFYFFKLFFEFIG